MPRVKVDRRSRDQRKRAARTRAVEIVAERAIQKQRAAEDAEAAADARGGGFRAGDDDDEEGWRTGQISVIDAEAMKGDWNGLWKDALARPAIALSPERVRARLPWLNASPLRQMRFEEGPVQETTTRLEAGHALRESALNADIDRLEDALETGADIDGKDLVEGNTALFEAARSGHTDVVKILLENGADVRQCSHCLLPQIQNVCRRSLPSTERSLRAWPPGTCAGPLVE